ncbi:glycosyltransferase family 4 protein [Dechloromonas sp. ZS-1]|uniref:glycosyltransferase family 4 protein n=1 Tax=Dechloromonas sp. ZS-1 TaxID=3138067 RepID=UPI0031FD32FE
MRVLVLSQYFWPEGFRINELVTALHAKGVEVEVLSGQPNYPGGVVFKGYRAWRCVRDTCLGVTVHRVPLAPRGKGAVRLALNYLSFILSALVFGTYLLRKRPFDAILVFAPSPILQAIPAIWLGRLKQCPTLLWVQDLWPESLSATGHVTHPVLLKGVARVVRWIYQKVDLLLVQSRAFTPKVRALAGSTPIVYYPNSFIDERAEGTVEPIVCPGLDCDFPIVFAGNIGRAQAVEVVLEAATLLRDVEGVRFVMVGDGSQRDWLMQQSANRGLSNLIFPGRYPVEAMPALMQKAAALLVTLADTEIFRLTIPSKIQAYLAAGRPIIACLNGAGAEIVEEAGAGVAVPAEDALALAEAVKTLYKMPESERFEMGAQGRRYYQEHFAHDKLVDTLIGHFEHAVRSQQGCR